jgi:hypothetical protein
VFQDRWIADGYASWAEHEAGLSSSSCAKPGAYPISDSPTLFNWVEPGSSPTPSDQAIMSYQRQAACYVMSSLASAIGKDRMLATIGAMRDGIDPYSSSDSPTKRASLFLNWQSWLDIVVERGLIPAGADPELAAGFLDEYGIALNRDLLEAHAKAVADYHALLKLTGAPAPASVTDPMRAWKFDAAEAAMGTASDGWKGTQSTETVLPELDVAAGKVRVAITSAATQEDLNSAKAQAEEQRALAREVADALALAAEPRDALQSIGLIGATLPTRAEALDAVARIDSARAHALAADIRSTIGSSRDLGVQRVAIAVGGTFSGLILLGGFIAFVRRRRGANESGPI